MASRACIERICVSARRVGRRAAWRLDRTVGVVKSVMSRRVVSQYAAKSGVAGVETAKGLSSSRPGARARRRGSRSRLAVSANRRPSCTSLLRPGIRHREKVSVFGARSVASMHTLPASSVQQGWVWRPSSSGFSAKLQPPNVGWEGQRIRARSQPVLTIGRISAQVFPGEL